MIQEERQRALCFNGGTSVDSTALAVKTQGLNQGGKNNKGKGRPQSWPFHGKVLQASWISTRVQAKGQGVYGQSIDS